MCALRFRWEKPSFKGLSSSTPLTFRQGALEVRSVPEMREPDRVTLSKALEPGIQPLLYFPIPTLPVGDHIAALESSLVQMPSALVPSNKLSTYLMILSCSADSVTCTPRTSLYCSADSLSCP